MGFYIRKGISFGPFRLNLSKSGLGVSVGVKGARVSTGPRGTYVHMGRHGLYYRQRIDGPGARSGFQDILPSEHYQESLDSSFESRVNETVDISRLVDSSSEELLSQINARAHQTAFAPLLAVGSIILSLVELAALEATPTARLIACAILATGLACAWMVHRRDTRKRTTPLFYELDERAIQHFAAVQDAVAVLGRSERVWRVESEQVTRDQKYNAGAASLLKRRQVVVGPMKPPFITTNIEVSGIDLGAEKLLFLPDRLFVFRGGAYGTVSYDSFNVTFNSTQFIESQGVPTDARVLYHTWQYVNKDGGPDRRFANNRQIPVLEYGLLTLKSATGLNVYLHVSNKSLALQFAEAFRNLQRY